MRTRENVDGDDLWLPGFDPASLSGDAERCSQEQKELERHILGAAKILRRSGDSRHYIFALLLYKRLCDVWEEEYEACQEHRFQIPEGCSWACARPSVGLGTALNYKLRGIEDANRCLEGVFRLVDFADKERLPEHLLKLLLLHFERHRLRLTDVPSPMLGAACEHFIENFAGDATLKHQERCTPRGVARVLAALVQPDEGMTIYDPVCGSGGLLLAAAHHLERARKDAKRLTLFGQEKNPLTWAICKMSLVLHGIDDASIALGDTLANPLFFQQALSPHGSADTLRRFDRAIANPPFSLKPWGHQEWKNDRFGRHEHGLPPPSCGDFAFVLHMLKSLRDSGRMAVVVPYGALFRLAEAGIRGSLLRQDLLDAVVGLGRIGTKARIAALVFQRDKRPEHRERVLIVNGELGEGHDKETTTLSDVNVGRLADAVRQFRSISGFCRVVTRHELNQNDFNLNIALYVRANNSPEHGSIGSASTRARPRQPDRARSAPPLDDAVRAAEAALEQARTIRDQHASEMLTHGLSGASHQQIDFGEIPSSWRLVRLKALLDEGPRNGIYKKEGGTGEEVLFIGQKALSSDGFVDVKEAKCLKLSKDELERFGLRCGDVLMKRVNGSKSGCGESALVRCLPGPVVFHSSIIRLRPDPARLDPLLLLHWLHHRPVRDFLTRRAGANRETSLRHGFLEDLFCPVIEDERERRSIICILNDLNEAVRAAAQSLAELCRHP